MEYLNLHSSALDSPEMAGADPAVLGTWLMLARYCAGQENGGVMAGCRRWPERKWQVVARVMQGAVMEESELWSWVGDDLVVRFYPAEQEAAVRAKREVARVNGARGGRPRRASAVVEACDDARVVVSDAGGKPGSVPDGKPDGEPVWEGVREGKERKGNERKGNERKGNETEVRECAPAMTSSMRVEEAEWSRQAEQVVGAYPRRERYAESLALVRSQLSSGEDFAVMLAGTRGAAAYLAQVPSGAANKYAPSALRFFEGRRWLDDPATLVRPASGAGGCGRERERGVMSAEEVAMQLGGRAMVD